MQYSISRCYCNERTNMPKLQITGPFHQLGSGRVGDTVTVDFSVGPAITPTPAALPLFATGLAGLGLLGWRRKRKAQAVA
jgi:hypothetical protein